MVHDAVDPHGLKPYDVLTVEPRALTHWSPEPRQKQPRRNLCEITGKIPILVLVHVGEVVADARARRPYTRVKRARSLTRHIDWMSSVPQVDCVKAHPASELSVA